MLLLSGLISIQERKALLKMFHVPQKSSFVLSKMMKNGLPKGAKVINDFEKILTHIKSFFPLSKFKWSP